MHMRFLFVLLCLLLVISLGAGNMPAGAAEATLPTPVAHWKLDDEGPVAKDATGSHQGAIQGAVPHAGRIGPGRLFVRSRQDHISIPYAPDLELSTFTVSAWVWLTEPPTFSGIVGTRAGGAQLFDVKVNADKVHGDIGDGKKWIETGVNFYAGDVGTTGAGEFMDGVIDDVRIWKEALTDDQVKQLMNP